MRSIEAIRADIADLREEIQDGADDEAAAYAYATLARLLEIGCVRMSPRPNPGFHKHGPASKATKAILMGDLK